MPPAEVLKVKTGYEAILLIDEKVYKETIDKINLLSLSDLQKTYLELEDFIIGDASKANKFGFKTLKLTFYGNFAGALPRFILKDEIIKEIDGGILICRVDPIYQTTNGAKKTTN